MRREVFLRGAAKLLADLASTVAPPAPASTATAAAAAAAAGDADEGEELEHEGERSGGGGGGAANGATAHDAVSSSRRVPADFFWKNEEAWRGCVRAGNGNAPNGPGGGGSDVAAAYEAVARAAEALGEAVRVDFYGAEVTFDSINNQLLLRKRPAQPTTPEQGEESAGAGDGGAASGAGSSDTEYYAPRDRNGKVTASSTPRNPYYQPPHSPL